jgi:CubicO group peptidase (beta-lactamase class C family)
MPAKPDRRTLFTTLAVLAAASGARASRPEIDAVLHPASGPPMASAGVIARRGGGRLALRLAAGHAYNAAGSRPFTVNQPFRVASVSKMIATTVFLDHALKTGLDLDIDASALLGFRLRHPNWPDVAITPRMLLGHTSGLRNGPSYPVAFGRPLAEALTPGGRQYHAGGWFGPAAHRPGAWFAYADINFAILAQILERRTGERFDRRMRDVLFQPLDLDIGYNWSGVSTARRAQAAAGVRRFDGPWTAQVDGEVQPAPWVSVARAPDAADLDLDTYVPGQNGFLFSPQGGLRLSLADMDRLARVMAARGRWRGRQVIPGAVLDLMQTRAWTLDPSRPNGEPEGVFKSYGLGCETPAGLPGPDGDTFFGAGTADWRGHSGDAYGWMTGLYWNIRDGRTLVWALNGMPETGRPPARRSCLTASEEVLVDLAMAAF